MWLLFASALAHPPDPSACFPACSPGYLCHDAACISACNPTCEPGFRCSAQRTCEPAPVASPPVGQGEVCVYRKKQARGAAWKVEMDGVTIGMVDAGRYRCFAAAAGDRIVRVMRPTSDRVSLSWVGVVVGTHGPSVFNAGVTVDGGATAGLMCFTTGERAVEQVECRAVSDAGQVGLKKELTPQGS